MAISVIVSDAAPLSVNTILSGVLAVPADWLGKFKAVDDNFTPGSAP
jgi:hypothetical protein